MSPNFCCICETDYERVSFYKLLKTYKHYPITGIKQNVITVKKYIIQK